MFKQNKYFKWYFSIIEKRKINPYTQGYCEVHHIIPKSMGGSNKKVNLVYLTAREHFICHMLLFRMTDGRNKVKMSYALRLMATVENNFQNRYKISSRQYSMLVEKTKSIISEAMKGTNNPFFGKTHTETSKKEMRAKRKLQSPPMLGKTHSADTRDKLRAAHQTQFKDPYEIEIRRQKNAIWFSNPENRKNAGKGSIGRSWYYDPITNISIKALPGEQPEGYIKGRILKKEV